MIYNIYNIIAFVVFMLYVLVNGHSYDDNANISADDDRKLSSESDSVEAYNMSSKEKPGKVTELKGNIKKVVGTYIKPELIQKGAKKWNYKTDYSYTVSIQKKGSHYASGALVDKRSVLTAAREFYNIRESIKLFKVRLGSVNCKKGGELVPLKWIQVHPFYVHKKPSYDIAILRIVRPLEFSVLLKPIGLSKMYGEVMSAKFLAAYWPRLIINGNVLPHNAKERIKPNSLRVSKQILIPWNRCFELNQRYNYSLDVSSLCLEPIMTHHSPCMPDTGAPIVGEDGLWGITSGWTSADCLTHPSPTVVTRISSSPIRSWLKSLI